MARIGIDLSRLYAEHMLGTALDVHVDSPCYDLPPGREEDGAGRVHHVADLGPFGLLDASATCDVAGGSLTVAVVNRDRDRSHTATIDLGGTVVIEDLQVSEVSRDELVRAPRPGRRPRAPPGSPRRRVRP